MHDLPAPRQSWLSRRSFFAAAGAGVAASAVSWTPAVRVPAGRTSTIPVPPDFPSGISLYQQTYQNWSEQIIIDDVWTCAPATPQDVVTLANWAWQNGYRLRAKGMGHNWSPLLLPNGASTASVVLLDTTQYLTALSITSGSPSTVTAQAGVTMDTLLASLEGAGLGLAAVPAPGDLTIGGVLAINGHGSALPMSGQSAIAGTSYGSLSNLIQSLTAVTWNGSAYALRTFERSDPAIAALLTHLGRSFITQVTLEAGTNQRMQCQSVTSISVSDLFAAPASAGSSSFASLVNANGGVEAIWFPFTSTPWIKLWNRSPHQPLLARAVSAPYNYGFANDISSAESSLISQIVEGIVSVTPTFEGVQIAAVDVGLLTTAAFDLWGWSKDVQLYVQPTTLRVTAAGYAIITARSSIQQVVSDFYNQYNATLSAFASQGQYPMNGPMEIRVTGLDVPGEAGTAGAVTPLLSSVAPRPDQPGWNVCVWIDMLTIPGTPQANNFCQQMEQWIFSHYAGSYATVRPEWSKGWAFTSAGAWTNTQVLTSTIPAAINAGQAGESFATAAAALDGYDPYRVFSNTFLDTLLP
jgi:hypothetical protein